MISLSIAIYNFLQIVSDKICIIQEPELKLELLLHQDGMDVIFCAEKLLVVFILNGSMIKTQVCSFYDNYFDSFSFNFSNMRQKNLHF